MEMKPETPEQRPPNLWQRFLRWLDDKEVEQLESRPSPAPNSGSKTEILLSKTQRIKLKTAVESSNTGDTRLYKKGYG